MAHAAGPDKRDAVTLKSPSMQPEVTAGVRGDDQVVRYPTRSNRFRSVRKEIDYG